MNITELNAEIRSLCDATTASYNAADLLRRVNNALEELIALIINADGTWEFDDTNYTDLPIGLGTLVEAQQDYSFSSEYLEILRIKIKNANGDWIPLKPIDEIDIPDGISIEEYFTTTGMPEYYDKIGDTIRFFPAPTATYVTLSNGFQVEFTRTASIFTSAEVTTGTKVPGIASPFHQLLAYMAAIPYCMTYKKDRVALFEKKVDDGKKQLVKHYARREKDKRKKATTKPIRFR